jgi:cytochrome c
MSNVIKKTAAFAVSGALALFASNIALANADLAKAKNCTACHAVDKKLIGPALNAIGAKYAADKDAVANLSTKVLKGGVGAWGNIAMPANPQVSPAEAEALVKWILTLK